MLFINKKKNKLSHPTEKKIIFHAQCEKHVVSREAGHGYTSRGGKMKESGERYYPSVEGRVAYRKEAVHAPLQRRIASTNITL